MYLYYFPSLCFSLFSWRSAGSFPAVARLHRQMAPFSLHQKQQGDCYSCSPSTDTHRQSASQSVSQSVSQSGFALQRYQPVSVCFSTWCPRSVQTESGVLLRVRVHSCCCFIKESCETSWNREQTAVHSTTAVSWFSRPLCMFTSVHAAACKPTACDPLTVQQQRRQLLLHAVCYRVRALTLFFFFYIFSEACTISGSTLGKTGLSCEKQTGSVNELKVL